MTQHRPVAPTAGGKCQDCDFGDVPIRASYDHYRDKFDLFSALVPLMLEGLEQQNVYTDDSCSSGLAGIALAVG